MAPAALARLSGAAGAIFFIAWLELAYASIFSKWTRDSA